MLSEGLAMRKRVILSSLLIVMLSAAGAVLAATSLAQVRNLRKKIISKTKGVEIVYKFDDEYLTLQAQAKRRGKEAAKVWAALKPDEKVIAVIGRSPFEKGNGAKGYWPAGIDESILTDLIEPLEKVGVKCVFPDLVDKSKRSSASAEEQVKPWPKVGFSDDYKFVLVIGFHYEPVPYRSGAYRVKDGIIYSKESRVNAWAILFYCPQATAFWASISSATADFRDGDNPVAIAARRALARLDFSTIGTDNIPLFIKKLRQAEKIDMLDIAGMLVQTQRADAVDAVIKVATSASAYKTTMRVLRYYNQRGTVQDYRTTPAEAKKRNYVLVCQPVMMRILLMERLRDIRGIQPSLLAARVDRRFDYEISLLGSKQLTQLGPICPDDELVLISELASRDAKKVFQWYLARAVRLLGRCKMHAEQALVVARYYAARKSFRPRRGRRPRRDHIKEAAQAAIAEITRTLSTKSKK